MRKYLFILTVLILPLNSYSQIDSSLSGHWVLIKFPSYEKKGVKKNSLRFTMDFKNDTLIVDAANRITCEYSFVDKTKTKMKIIKGMQTSVAVECRLKNGFVFKPDDILDSIIMANNVNIDHGILQFKRDNKLIAELRKENK